MTRQLAVRLPDAMVKEVDRLVAAGRYESRTDAVRVALERLLDEVRRQDVDEAIVRGYERVPDGPVDNWVEAATEALVKDEPW